LVIIAILIAVALFLLGQVIIRRVAHNDPWLTKALTVCLLLHLACAPAQIWVVDHIYGGISDYNGYVSKGAILSNGFRHLDFSLAPAHLPGIVSDGSVSIVTGVVFAIIGVNKLGAFFVFSFFSFVGTIFFYRAFTTTFGRAGSRRYGYLIFFLPTLVFWTSDVSKEAIMTFLLGLTGYGCARILAYRKGGYWLVVLSSAAGVFIRPNEVLLALGGFTMGMLLRPPNPNVRLEGPRRTIALVFLGSLLAAAIYVTLHYLPGVNGSLSLTKINTNNNGGQLGAGFGSSNISYSPSIWAYPKDIYSVLFDPLPLTAHGTSEWISAVENTVLLVVVLTSIRRLLLVPRVALARTYVAMCLVFTVAFLYAFASLGNAGLIERERAVMMPFFLVLLCIPCGPRHGPPRYEWELPRRVRIARRKAMAARTSAVSRARMGRHVAVSQPRPPHPP
jgi:hypothetical protein